MANQSEHIPEKSALQQYRELIGQHSETISSHTAECIRDTRLRAAERLLDDETLAFPRRGSDGYEYTDMDKMFHADMGLNINRLPVSAEVENLFRCGLPNISPLLGLMVNDTYRPTDRLLKLLPEGVTVTTFRNADDAQKAIIEKYYGRIADWESDDRVATLLNTALAQDGLLIRFAKGVRLDKPLQLVNILKDFTSPDGKALPVMAVRRLLIVMDENSSGNLLVCDHDMNTSSASTSTRVSEVVLGPGAQLDVYELEESTDLTSRYNRIAARLSNDSTLNIFNGTLKPGTTRNDIEVHLDAPGARLSIDGMAIIDGEQTGDNNAVVYHHAPRCHSRQTFKYLVRENGKGAFEGLIRVDHGAAGTEAYQNDRNILADATARMHSRPQLEIYCDDVKCSHGAATGQIDERALFYMRSRGIDEPQARAMLMNAFMSDVLEGIALAPLRDRLKHLVELRLAGKTAHCSDCPIE